MTAVDTIEESTRLSARAELSVLLRSACTIARLRGDLDISTTPALREQLFDMLGTTVPLLIIDLSEVWFCDVAGLAVLIATQRRAAARRITVRLAAPPPPDRGAAAHYRSGPPPDDLRHAGRRAHRLLMIKDGAPAQRAGRAGTRRLVAGRRGRG